MRTSLSSPGVLIALLGLCPSALMEDRTGSALQDGAEMGFAAVGTMVHQETGENLSCQLQHITS